MPKQLKLYSLDETSGTDCQATTRRLKVYYGSYQGGNYSRHLRAYGFKTSDTVEVKLSSGRIEITRLNQE